MSTEEIRSQAIRVHALRQLAASARAAADEARARWEQENEEILFNAKRYSTEAAEAEAELRELAIEEYYKTRQKSLGYGVGVRVGQRCDYSDRLALTWCKEHDLFLTVDAKNFERFAKEHLNDLAFVSVTEQVTATIATDLAKALGIETTT